MEDPDITKRKYMVLGGFVAGAGLIVTGLVIKAKGFVMAPQRRGSTPLYGESAQEYAFFPIVLGALLIIGCVAYWWTEIRPLLGGD